MAWDHECITVEMDFGPVTALSFLMSEWQDTLNICLAFTHPSFRRRGFYRRAFGHLITLAQDRNIGWIEGGRHVNNRRSEMMQHARGSRDAFISTLFKVPDKITPPPSHE